MKLGCSGRLILCPSLVLMLATSALLLCLPPSAALAQDSANDEQDRAAQIEEALAASNEEAPAEADEDKLPAPQEQPSVNILELIFRGGWLMVPIAIMSLIVVAFGVERGLALRREKIMPSELIEALGDAAQHGTFDPRKAYRLCQQYPSTAATVIRAMLLKVGRPHSEVEHAVAEASEREAARLFSNVRWLVLAAAVTPLIGLLGTVWGMIQAFFATANMPAGVNKAELLADGIYVALVTTAGGLAVAIPAAVLAHLFEGRIQVLLREIDELLFNLLPQVERFEGKLRVSRQQLGSESRRPPMEEPPPIKDGAKQDGSKQEFIKPGKGPTAPPPSRGQADMPRPPAAAK